MLLDGPGKAVDKTLLSFPTTPLCPIIPIVFITPLGRRLPPVAPAPVSAAARLPGATYNAAFSAPCVPPSASSGSGSAPAVQPSSRGEVVLMGAQTQEGRRRLSLPEISARRTLPVSGCWDEEYRCMGMKIALRLQQPHLCSSQYTDKGDEGRGIWYRVFLVAVAIGLDKNVFFSLHIQLELKSHANQG